MLFLIPTSTDAPLYHLPIATGVTIAANVLMFVLQLGIPEFTERWALQHGTFNPVNCLVSAYLHADFFHLFNNMIFLFIFGLIVEGKIGWWKFLLAYNACAFGESILESLIMLGWTAGFSLGASSAIFGIMIIAFLWAPENEIHFKFVGIFLLSPITSSFDISMSTLTYLFVALNFVIAAFTGFEMSSAVLHLLGIPIGLAIGWGMLAAKRVNCDGHDFISIMTGKRGQEQLTVNELAEQEERRQELILEKRKALTDGLKMVAHYIDRGHYEVGFKRFEALARKREGLVLDESLLIKMINGLEKDPGQGKLYRKLLKYYLSHYQRLHTSVTFKLAKLLMQRDQQPRKAMKLLQRLDQAALSPAEKKTLAKLARFGKQQIFSGAIEVQNDDD
jgi:membrane associated rhomboid family serine protease/uncharacterized protein YnzC (UPF0291/DUF896 family)